MTILTSEWGPEQTSVSYRLLVESDTFGVVEDLSCGFGIDQLQYERADAVKITRYCLERGRLRPQTRTIIPSQIKEISADVLLPQGYTLWSPLSKLAGKNCPRDVFACYLCPTDPRLAHFVRFPDTIFDEPERTTKFIEHTDNPIPLEAKTTAHFLREMHYFALQAAIVQVVTDAPPLASVAFAPPDCVDCGISENSTGYYAGEDVFFSTNDGFASGTDLTPAGLAVGSSITGIYASGNAVTIVSKLLTAGAIYQSIDGGVTWTETTPAAAPALEGIIRAQGYFYAFGGAAPVIYRSLDGSTWDALPLPASVTATMAFTDASYDPYTDTLYLSGTDTVNGVAVSIKDGIVTDISARVGVTAHKLYTVGVLGPDHVMFGGAAGYISENAKLGTINLFTAGSVGLGQISVILGDEYQTIIAGGSTLYTRNICNDFRWAELLLVGGVVVTGNYTDGANGDLTDGVNNAVLVTDDGEIIRIYPPYPGGLA